MVAHTGERSHCKLYHSSCRVALSAAAGTEGTQETRGAGADFTRKAGHTCQVWELRVESDIRGSGPPRASGHKYKRKGVLVTTVTKTKAKEL